MKKLWRQIMACEIEREAPLTAFEIAACAFAPFAEVALLCAATSLLEAL